MPGESIMTEAAKDSDGHNLAVLAPRHVVQMRKDTCQNCDKLTRVAGALTCSACNCFVAWKTKLMGARCPAGLW